MLRNKIAIGLLIVFVKIRLQDSPFLSLLSSLPSSPLNKLQGDMIMPLGTQGHKVGVLPSWIPPPSWIPSAHLQKSLLVLWGTGIL